MCERDALSRGVYKIMRETACGADKLNRITWLMNRRIQSPWESIEGPFRVPHDRFTAIGQDSAMSEEVERVFSG